jgi:flagellar basal-body rod protein FlgB
VSAESHVVLVGARALDGLSMRMAALAHNMANVNTPRFRSVEVRFEEQLRAAEAQGDDALDRLRFGFAAGPAFTANDDRRIDLLIADASHTAMRYAALVDMLGRRIALRSAVLGGAR